MIVNSGSVADRRTASSVLVAWTRKNQAEKLFFGQQYTHPGKSATDHEEKLGQHQQQIFVKVLVLRDGRLFSLAVGSQEIGYTSAHTS